MNKNSKIEGALKIAYEKIKDLELEQEQNNKKFESIRDKSFSMNIEDSIIVGLKENVFMIK